MSQNLYSVSSAGCGNPPLLVNGGFSADVGVVTQPNEPFPLDTQIEYFCIDGFKLDDPDGFTSTCLQDNRWSLNQSSPEFPRCQPGSLLRHVIRPTSSSLSKAKFLSTCLLTIMLCPEASIKHWINFTLG